MVHQVKVRRPVRSVDRDVLVRALGEEPVQLSRADRIPAPWIIIDDRIHAPTSAFLWHHCRSSLSLSTATRMASDLARWVRFLVDDRRLSPYEDVRDPVLLGTEDRASQTVLDASSLG